MKKKQFKIVSGFFEIWKSKLFLTIKLTVIALCLAVFQGFALITYGQSAKVNLKMENVSIKQVLNSIEDQTNLFFMYNGKLVDVERKVNVNVDNQSINNVLEDIFFGTNVQYEIYNRQILLSNMEVDTSSSIQQQKSISGKVTDSSGAPFPGVTVVIKGSNKGTITDMDGKFILTNVPGNAKTLLFSFIGMKTQEVAMGNKIVFSVMLEEETVGIEEVVAIGYGSVKRKDLIGSVASVKMVDMSKAPVSSFDQALAGRVAGVQVSSVDGQPGSSVNIVIRGNNSVTQDNSPLYVVDGFPLENNDNNSINPNDIESIDVLKDASATAIYGARGANGVIMITTKRGKSGIPVVKYDGYYGFQNNDKKIAVLSPYEFVKLQLEIDNAYATENYLKDGKTLDYYKDAKAIDWYDRIMQNGQSQSHNLSVSGGTDKSKYSVSASIDDQDGVVKYSGYKRYQGRVTLDQNISDKAKFGMSANYSDSENYGTFVNNTVGNLTSGGLMYSAWSFRPLELETVTLSPEEDIFDPLTDRTNQQVNPYVQLKNETRQTKSTNLFANAYAEYSITKHLKFRVTGGISKSVRKEITFNNSKTRSGSPLYPQSLGVNGNQVSTENVNLSNENTLTYSKHVNKDHFINVVGGFSSQTGKVSSFGAMAIYVPNESLGISGLDEGTPQTITSNSSIWTLQSFFSRISYSYKSKYSLDATMRADGSSRFSLGNKWGYFPSVGLTYRLSKEEFMKDFQLISDAKIRVSYGETGNNRVGDFPYLSSMAFLYGYGYSYGNAVPSIGGVPSSLSNADLKWETTNQFNVGVDLYLLKDRISFTGDYYYKKTNDLLLNSDIPVSTGFQTAYKNIGSVSNSGFEFTLNSYNFQSPKFKWNTSFNISFNKNKVVKLAAGQESLLSVSPGVYGGIAKYIAKVGQPIALFYGTIFDGLYQYSDFNVLTNGTYVLKDEIPGNGSTRSAIQPGHAKYKDLNGDGVVNSSDYTVIGNPNPIFTGGFSNNFEYKGFDLNVFFQFSYGNDVMNANRIVFEGGDNYLRNVNMYATYANRWSPTNTNTNIPNRSGRGPQYWSTLYVEDASFLRLKTVSLGYTIPGKIVKSIKMKSIRIYTSAQNLYTWTGYSGLDPEVSVRHSALTPGLDYSAYPRARTIIFGVNASF